MEEYGELFDLKRWGFRWLSALETRQAGIHLHRLDMLTMRHSLISVLLPLLSLFWVAPVFSAEPINIGVSLGLTGKYAEMSDMSMKAYRLWEADINQKGGLLGKQVHVSIYDDKGDPAIAAEIYKRLIEEENVDFVFGPYSSEITEAVVPITERNHYPLLAAGAAADALWQQGYKYLFGIYVPTGKYVTGFLEMLAGEGFNDIAMLGADDLFSRDLAAGAKEWIKRFEMKVVFSEEFKKGTKSLTQPVLRVKASGAQVLMVFGHLDESINVRLALKEVNWLPKIYYATVGPAVTRFRDVLGSDADYVFSSSQWEPIYSFAGAKEFAESFMQNYKVMPSYHAAGTYAAGQLLEAAVKKTRSMDREKIKEVLSVLDTMTVMGRYGVDRAGRQTHHFTTTIQWQNGRKEIVAPPEFATAKPLWR